MSMPRQIAWACGVVMCAAAAWGGSGGANVRTTVELKDLSLDHPLILNQNADYHLDNVSVIGLIDSAALTLSGRIASVSIAHSSFGQVRAGADGRAAGLDCAGAVVERFLAKDTSFFDAENQLASLKDGTFGQVTFEHCRFTAGESFLRHVYADAPWRTWPPVTEFYNIDRLELLDDEFSNTTVIIHPSVKQVVIRGSIPGLQISNPQATQVIQLSPEQTAESAPPAMLILAAAR